MQKIMTYNFSKHNNSSMNFRAERVSTAAPKIKREFLEEGVRMYETEDDKIFDADKFDQNFVPIVTNKKVLPQNYKGQVHDPKQRLYKKAV